MGSRDRGPVEPGGPRHRLRSAPLRSPSGQERLRGGAGVAVELSVAQENTRVPPLLKPPACTWKHTLTHTRTHAGKEEAAAQSQNDSGKLRSANLL